MQKRTPRISNKRLRDVQRIAHIAAGLLLLIQAYAPLGDSASFTLITRILVLPLLVGSGFAMWQFP